MKKRLLAACFLGVLGAHLSVQAQSSKHNWGLGIAPSTYSFYALKSGGGLFNGEDYGGGVMLSLYRYLGASFDMGLETGFGRVRHPKDLDATLPSIRDNFFHAQLGIQYKFDNGYILKKDFVVSPFIHTGFGTNTYKTFQDWGMHVPVGVGIRFRVPNNPVQFNIQSNYNIGILQSESFLQHSLGVVVDLGICRDKSKNPLDTKPETDLTKTDKKNKKEGQPQDRDFDNVPDEIDRCPDIFGSDLTAGCPDTDGDGVQDGDDKCPDEKGFANLLGCADADHDGVIDPDDKCPDVYGEVPTGCPAADANDIDGDGVANEVDACADVKGLFTAQGCPDQDGDGIRDEVDECPDYFGNAEHNGCPLPKKELDRMRKIYEHQQLAKQYALDDSRNPYNPRNDAFDPTDPYNPFNPRNSAFDVKHPENPFNPDNNYFDINNPHNPYNPKSANYNPKLNDIKEYDPDKHRPKNPSDLDPKDPKNFGRIVIGLPTSEKYGDYYKPKKHGQGSHGGQHIAGNGNSGKGGKGGRSGGIDNPNNPLTFDPNFKYEHTPDSLTGFNPTNIKLTKEEEEYCQRVDLSDLKAAIYFQPSNASANISSLKSLDKIVEAMRRCAILEVQIAGHADADGSDNSNLTLSEKRAKAVLRYITGQGISNKRLKYNAYGEQYPAAPNDNPDGKQQNRRTEIQVRKN